MLKPINAKGVAWPGVSSGVIMQGSGYFVTTGHVGADEKGDPIVSSAEDQISGLFEGLKRTLAAANLEFKHVARMTCFVRDFEPETMNAIRSVRKRYFNADCPPASVIVQATLYDPRLLVEAEVMAVVP